MILQWIVTDTVSGRELLITYWESDEYIEVAPRLDETRWGAPFPVRMIDEEGREIGHR